MSTLGPQVRSELGHEITLLASPDAATRNRALGNIKSIVKHGANTAEIAAVLNAARRDIHPDDNGMVTADSSLLMAIHHLIKPAHIEIIVRRAPELSQAGYAWALLMLASLQSNQATSALVTILKRLGWPKQPIPSFMNPYITAKSFASDILPPIIDNSIRGISSQDRGSILLEYLQAGALSADLAAAAQNQVLHDAVRYLEMVAPLQRTAGIGWRWEEDYCELKSPLGISLDLLGRLSRSSESVAILRRAETLSDPYLRLCAVLSLLRHGEAPTAGAVLAVAEAAETRGDLFSGLHAIRRLDLFPMTEIAQEKLAEWDMVNWLKYPTELGRAPDEIELMKTIQKHTGPLGGGTWVYYIFRFRCHPPHWSAEDGWTAGVSGPFRKKDFPTLHAWGDTFSEFKKWDEFSPNAHLASAMELMKRWRENKGE